MPKLKSFRRKRKKGLFKKILVICIWLIIAGIILGSLIFIYFAKDLPDPEKITERRIIESTKIYDRTGKFILYDVHGEEKRTVIAFEEIPQYVKNATIISEDDDFYHHFGIDIKGILRSVIANFTNNRISQGGSTITQQFIKNAILTSERTYTRKIKEAILAIQMEMKYSKDEILNFYLNQVPYGSSAYGIEAAAQTFFNKNAKDLTLAEGVTITALTNATTYYSPYGSNLDKLKERQEYILDRMYKFGYITEQELNEAKQEKLEFSPVKGNIKAPHFIMYIKEYLEEKYGKEYMEKAGLNVYTTLDFDLQQKAEQIVKEQVEKNIKSFNAHNASLVAIDPKTGQILAMVGSKDYFGESSPDNCTPGKNCLFEPNVNVSIRNRQPGSSFKPFAYAAAFKKGFTPNTLIYDLKTNFAVDGADDYIPQNYDGKFRGPVTLKNALAQSLNIPSVKTLYLAGIDETISLAQDMGIQTLKDRSRFGLSLVLGGGEVKLLEQTAAFGVFANGGEKHKTSFILKIEDSEKEILEEFKDEKEKVLDEEITRLITDILSSEELRMPMFGLNSKLYINGIPSAVKTGTTQEYRDGWTIGYTPSLVVGVWAGNNNNTSMKEGAGFYVAAPIWNEFIKQAYEIKKQVPKDDLENYFNLQNNEEFVKPKEIITDKPILNGNFVNEIKIKINKVNEKIATNLTPIHLIEDRIYREAHTILYYINKDNPQKTGDSKNDSQFNNWENPVIDWANSPERFEIYNQEPPIEYDN